MLRPLCVAECFSGRSPSTRLGAESPSKGKTAPLRQYFAILREQRGLNEERVTTAATSPTALYDELRVRHGFTLAATRVRAAVNDEFVAAGASLREGDRVVFIPPVAGG